MRHSPNISEVSIDAGIADAALNPHCRPSDQAPSGDFPVYCPADRSWIGSGQDLQCDNWTSCDWIPDEPNDPGYDCWHCLNAGPSYTYWDGTWE